MAYGLLGELYQHPLVKVFFFNGTVLHHIENIFTAHAVILVLQFKFNELQAEALKVTTVLVFCLVLCKKRFLQILYIFELYYKL